jgi:hypothetical protein
MNAALSRRIKALEAARVQSQRGGVLVLRRGESSEDGIRRAQAEDRCGAFLIVPAPMDQEAWACAVRVQQIGLCQLEELARTGNHPERPRDRSDRVATALVPRSGVSY